MRQNSGKTSLIVRWAVAANRGGSSVFLIDVKGNLHKKLHGKLQGKVFHFSTDPTIRDCDRVNFLAPLDPTRPEGTERIQGFVAALLPAPNDRSRGDEEDFHRGNRVVWLTALIHLVKLLELYQPDIFQGEDGRPRSADLGDLYTFAVDERSSSAWCRRRENSKRRVARAAWRCPAAVSITGRANWQICSTPPRFPAANAILATAIATTHRASFWLSNRSLAMEPFPARWRGTAKENSSPSRTSAERTSQ